MAQSDPNGLCKFWTSELFLASAQTSFGVRSSREKWMRDQRTPKDICGEAKLFSFPFERLPRRLGWTDHASGRQVLFLVRMAHNITTSQHDKSTLRHCKASTPNTGSRGDVFVVRTSKPVKNLWKNGLFWSRYSFVTHSMYRKPRGWGLVRSAYSYSALHASVARRATCCAPPRLWLAVIDFQNGEQQSRSGSDKKRRNRLQYLHDPTSFEL